MHASWTSLLCACPRAVAPSAHQASRSKKRHPSIHARTRAPSMHASAPSIQHAPPSHKTCNPHTSQQRIVSRLAPPSSGVMTWQGSCFVNTKPPPSNRRAGNVCTHARSSHTHPHSNCNKNYGSNTCATAHRCFRCQPCNQSRRPRTSWHQRGSKQRAAAVAGALFRKKRVSCGAGQRCQ